MNTTDSSNIHRYLDEAFAGVATTPESQDLREELRGNLTARVSELVVGGLDEQTAAKTAIAELGDIRPLIDSLTAGGPGAPRGTAADAMVAQFLNRVRPKPAFVVRTVMLSAILAVAAVVVTLGSFGAINWTIAALVAIAAVAGAVPIGVIVADGLHQETSQNYPLPMRRAVSFGMASAVGLLGLEFVGLFFAHLDLIWLVVSGAALALVALIAFIVLGVTQTNRKKAWARAMNLQYEAEDRFSQDPVAAARFGIYTVVIWILAIAAFVVLSIVVGFVWSWLALVAGLIVFMLVLARMLFPANSKGN
jgi:MFS family permease